MNGVLQLVGFILNTIGYICVLYTTFFPEWRIKEPAPDVLEPLLSHQGIWVWCIAYPTGHWICRGNGFSSGVPGHFQAARGLTISAIVIGMLGFVISLLGMKFTSFMDNNPRVKYRTSMIGAACFGISGLAIGIAVSYFAHQVLSGYDASLLFPYDIGPRYAYGECLYVGWAAMAILLHGSLLTGCDSSVDDEEDSATRYGLAYNKSYKPNTEHV